MDTKTNKPPTFFGAPTPGVDDEDLPKKCWNGGWYER
tara:strand:- start:2673 stop:2783 length:111 start_codon:yes stop_codon:yes gene_type:complete